MNKLRQQMCYNGAPISVFSPFQVRVAMDEFRALIMLFILLSTREMS
jgi:hypothetical protein